ncbi:MAG: hypothetical protein IPN93_17435 [Bacteroidetes bacterium]|nr:hypothetical protein [Bacteroidota bacterium]
MLAKSQEAQNKISQAIQNYEDAGSDDFGIAETPSSNSNESNIEDIEKPTTDKKDINGKLKQETAFGYFNQINLNDVNRLKNNSNLDKNVDLLENNIKLLEDEKAKKSIYSNRTWRNIPTVGQYSDATKQYSTSNRKL